MNLYIKKSSAKDRWAKATAVASGAAVCFFASSFFLK